MSIPDALSLALAASTALMAGATIFLAIWTRSLAKSTADAIRQAERHHQESLRPFCVIDFFGADKQNPFGEEFEPRARFGPDASKPPKALISVRGMLHNKGMGLAKDIVVYLNMRRGEGEDGVYRLTSPVVVSALIGAGEAATINVAVTERNVMSVWRDVQWNPVVDFQTVVREAYEVVLQYVDAFDNPFRTVHPKGIWRDQSALIERISETAMQHELMVQPDRPVPVFLTGKQDVRTAADFFTKLRAITPSEASTVSDIPGSP